MDACNIDEIQNLFIYYSACFSKYFPELGFYCNEREFQIHGIVRRYSDITGVSHDGSYFLIEMQKRIPDLLTVIGRFQIPHFN